MSYLSDFFGKYGFPVATLVISLLIACVYVPYAARRASERLDDQIRAQSEGHPSLGEQVVGGVARRVAERAPASVFGAAVMLIGVAASLVVDRIHAGLGRSLRE